MSHLSRHSRKQSSIKFLILIVIIAIAGIFFIQIGLKSLINATLFINDTFSSSPKEATEKKKESFFGTLYLDDLPSATNSAELFVSGEAADFDLVEFYINNTKVKEQNLKKEAFNEKIGKLKEGENKIYVVAKTEKDDNKKESETYTVIYKKEPPKLEITSPKENDTVNKQDLNIEGKTDKDVSMSVNGQPVVVDLKGNFKKSYHLKEGENKLEFIAEDEAGNTEKKTITVKYQKDE